MNYNQREPKSLTEQLDLIVKVIHKFADEKFNQTHDISVYDRVPNEEIGRMRSRLAALGNEAEQSAKIEEARSDAPIAELREILDDLTTQFDRTRNILGEVRNIARTAHRFAEKQYRVGYNAALEEAAKEIAECSIQLKNDSNTKPSVEIYLAYQNRAEGYDGALAIIRSMKKEPK